MSFFDRLFGIGRGQPGSDTPPEVRAEPPVARKTTAEARITPPAGVPPGVDPELFARLKAYADEAAAADPVDVARASLSDIKAIQERNLEQAPDLSVDDARYVATHVCWKPSMFDEPEVTAIYREVREFARDIARRWRRAGGRIVPDNRMFEMLESSMTEAERVEHQSLMAEDCELVTKGMLAAAQLALLPADALERGEPEEEDDD
jgi:hypothetical protein